MPELTASSVAATVLLAQDSASAITPSRVLSLMPDGLRYLFLDEILEVTDTHICARYQFRENDYFYEGHFPDRAITPGTILLEAMCQCGITAHSYFFLAKELGVAAAKRYRVLFTNSQAEFFELIGPGAVVTIHSELLAWRLRRIRARVKMLSEKKTLIAESVLAGLGVCWSAQDDLKSSLSPASEAETTLGRSPR